MSLFQSVLSNPNDGELITLCKILDTLLAICPSVTAASKSHTKVSEAGTNATTVKSSAGLVYNFIATNIANQTRYVKFYDKSTVPNPSVDSPDYIIPLQNGQTITLALGVAPFYFHNGISFAIVTSASNDGPVGVGDVVLSFTWS